MTSILLDSLIVGVGATLVMDLAAWLCLRLFAIQPLNYAFVGRWLIGITHGKFRHNPIMASPSEKHEFAIGWFCHYAIGVVYAYMYLILANILTLNTGNIALLLLFTLSTLVMPFFVMQPCFGFGIAANKTPHPLQVRLKSLLAHLSFGVGLYIMILLLLG